MYILSPEKKLSVISSLLEGNSVRSTERMTGVHRDTICRLLVAVGDRCAAIMDSQMRNLNLRYLQLDECWTYVAKKRRRVRKDDPPEFGDAWCFVCLDEESKLIPSFLVGKRTQEDTARFLWDVYSRLASPPQITSDGLVHYTRLVPECFEFGTSFSQLIKLFGDYGQFDTPEARYSPPRIAEVISRVRLGDPDPEHISTSFVERGNLTLRMAMRRFTRLTNGFSKKLSHLRAACALHFAHYNFCRVHSSLRVTPAMAAGLTSEVWPLASLIGA
jgi:IS1 family transposase